MILTTALVIPFPRAQRVAADYSTSALLRSIRLSARAIGCTIDQAREVSEHAETLLGRRMDPKRIVPAADSYAHQLLTRDRAPTTGGAA